MTDQWIDASFLPDYNTPSRLCRRGARRRRAALQAEEDARQRKDEERCGPSERHEDGATAGHGATPPKLTPKWLDGTDFAHHLLSKIAEIVKRFITQSWSGAVVRTGGSVMIT